MAITYRSSTGVNWASGADVVITKPTGTVDGDILVAVIYHDTAITSVPSGWTLIHTTLNTANASSYWKRAASEGASYTWSHTSNYIGGSMAAYSGCLESGDPIDAASENSGTSDTLTWTGITTTVANAMLVGLIMKVSDVGVTAATATSPLTNNERTDVQGTALYDGIQASAGSSGDKTVSLGGWIAWVGHLIALKPATGGGGSVIAIFPRGKARG